MQVEYAAFPFLTCQRALIPTIQYNSLDVSSESEIDVVNGVFVISSEAMAGERFPARRWYDDGQTLQK